MLKPGHGVRVSIHKHIGGRVQKCRVALVDSVNMGLTYFALEASGFLDPRPTIYFIRKDADRTGLLQGLAARILKDSRFTFRGYFESMPLQGYSSPFGIDLRERSSSRHLIKETQTFWRNQLRSAGVNSRSQCQIVSGNTNVRNVIADLLPRAECVGVSHGLSDELDSSLKSELPLRLQQGKEQLRHRLEKVIFGYSQWSFRRRQKMLTRLALSSQDSFVKSYSDVLALSVKILQLRPLDDRGSPVLLLLPEAASDYEKIRQLSSLVFSAIKMPAQTLPEEFKLSIKGHPTVDLANNAARTSDFLTSLQSELQDNLNGVCRISAINLDANEIPAECWIAAMEPQVVISSVSTTLLYAALNGFKGRLLYYRLGPLVTKFTWQKESTRQELMKWERLVPPSRLQALAAANWASLQLVDSNASNSSQLEYADFRVVGEPNGPNFQ